MTEGRGREKTEDRGNRNQEIENGKVERGNRKEETEKRKQKRGNRNQEREERKVDIENRKEERGKTEVSGNTGINSSRGFPGIPE